MTTSTDEPAYKWRFWAKSDRQDHRRIHLLEHHMADVGACFEALLAQPIIRRRLARTAGLDDIDGVTVARLALFAALHDIGKVNVGFQTQIWRDADLPSGQRRPRHAGHTLDLVPVLNCKDTATAKWFLDALGWWYDATESWDDLRGETVCALFVASLSHHGTPLQMDSARSANPAIWRSFGNLRPEEYVRCVGQLARGWFQAAWEPGPPFPSAPAFQHMFMGLCNLADWVGSNRSWFEYVDVPQDDYMATAREKAWRAVEAMGMDVHGQRGQLAGRLDFEALFPSVGHPPNAIQRAVYETPEERLVVIESETGSGKTEAALWRFAHMYEEGLVDGLYFALPTRAAATQIHDRVTLFVKQLLPSATLEPVLAVPGYLRAGEITGRQLPYFEVEWDDRPDDATRHRRWAAESAKRYLAAQVAVGTVDQAMMAALRVKNAHMRAACLARNLLVVDEVHASDTYMRRILKALLDAHLDAGGYALLMSATLGSAARHEWLSSVRPDAADAPTLGAAKDAPYPAMSTMTADGPALTAVDENGREKDVNVVAESLMHDFGGVGERALQAARDGAKVLVVRNTVRYAIDTQQAMERAAGYHGAGLLFSCNGVPTLHHGRFAAGDRRLLDRVVEEQLGKERASGGLVVVGTQTLEQSLDIDADVLITDLCPMDVLLQRIGRLHRHSRDDRPAGYDAPRCVVLTPDEGDLTRLLQRGPNRNGLGPYGYVYEDLRILEATRRLVAELPQWDIPVMNRGLVEPATHPEALEEIVQGMGDDWRVHANHVTGGRIAEGLTAANAVIQRDKSFFTDNRDLLFPSGDEEKLRTRLGDDNVDIGLDPLQASPFDEAGGIENLAVSIRWLPKGPLPESVQPTPEDDGFTFAVGDRSFRYDRLGLRRA